MSFYDEWIQYKNTDLERRYIDSFLSTCKESVEVFHSGTEFEISVAIAVINSVSISTYVSFIDQMSFSSDVETYQIPQFSELNDGIYRIPELLEFSSKGMSFEEIGYQ